MNLVQLNKNEPITTSEVIAVGTDKTHKSVMELIYRYEKELQEFGLFTFETRKSKGRPMKYALLNEGQVYFLFTLMRNNDQMVLFKKKLVKEFMRMRKALMDIQMEKTKDEWKDNRLKGISARKEVTDVIKDFVNYATRQGSQNAVMYYSNITRMENKALFILEQKYPNVREMLNSHQLSSLYVADHIVKEALQDGMDDSMNYKDIYKMAKDRVTKYAQLIKPTAVITFDKVKV